jgi:hypothetical protein
VVHLSPGLRASEPYPFEELDRRKAAAIADGRSVVDFGVGDPREETPAFIREALKDAIQPTSSYPRAAGLPEPSIPTPTSSPRSVRRSRSSALPSRSSTLTAASTW